MPTPRPEYGSQVPPQARTPSSTASSDYLAALAAHYGPQVQGPRPPYRGRPGGVAPIVRAPVNPKKPSQVYVWLGGEVPNRGGSGALIPSMYGYRDQFAPIESANNMWATLPPEGKAVMYDTMDRYYGVGRWQPSWVKGFWQDAVRIAADRLNNYNERVSPLQVFDLVVSSSIASGASGARSGGGGGGGGGGAYGGVSTQTSVATTITDPDSARRLLNQTLDNALGRQSTPQEQDEFLAILTKREKDQPSKTVTKQKVSGSAANSVSSSDSTTTGGTDAGQLALEYAMTRPDYAEYQAATTYLDAFINALSSPIQGI